MAKHPHLLLLINKKTWKCTLDGCGFFVHLGLAHVLVGKNAICWNCEGIFSLTESSLRDDKPICPECKIGVSEDVLEKYIQSKLEGTEYEGK
jgi:hypothetical protein